MRVYKKLIYLFSVIFIITLVILIIINPTVCKEGAINGILICGRVIIPSLYPFTVCVLFIMKSGMIEKLQPISPLTNAVFGISAEQFSIMTLSFIGGFPVGAKLIDEYVKQGKLTESQGTVMLNYCINAGPAFIISAVGVSIIGSKEVGYVLLVSHLFASLVLCFISRFFKAPAKTAPQKPKKRISPADNFVLSASEAASAVFNICAFVILFSAINAYLAEFSAQLPFLKYLLYITEVTNGITYTDNTLLISFLLGFSGICIWCQVIAAAKSIKPNLIFFTLFRLLHGALSAAITTLLLKVTDIALPTFSSNHNFLFSALYSTPALSISMLSMSIIFLISLGTKKYTGKILEDMI